MDYLKSSADSNKYSATLKGLVILAIPFIIAFGQRYNVEITETQIMQVMQDVTFIYGAILFIFGFVRKCYYWIVNHIMPLFKK